MKGIILSGSVVVLGIAALIFLPGLQGRTQEDRAVQEALLSQMLSHEGNYRSSTLTATVAQCVFTHVLVKPDGHCTSPDVSSWLTRTQHYDLSHVVPKADEFQHYVYTPPSGGERYNTVWLPLGEDADARMDAAWDLYSDALDVVSAAQLGDIAERRCCCSKRCRRRSPIRLRVICLKAAAFVRAMWFNGR